MPTALPVVLLALVAALNLVPVVVLVAPERARRLYGLDPSVLADPVTRLLLRHRGVLFGILSVWLGAGALVPELRAWAVGSALVAKLAFLGLYVSEPKVRAPLGRVAAADVIAVVLLVIALSAPPS